MTAPDATAGDGLRELREQVADWIDGSNGNDQQAHDQYTWDGVDQLLALPALRDVLAAAEKWRRVEAVLSAIPTGVVASAYLLGDLRRALDGNN